MTKTKLSLLAAGSILALGLSACGGGGDGDISPPPGGGGGGGGGGGDPMIFADNFGDTFSAAYQADENDEPIDPMDGDLPAIDKTADPLEPPT